MFCEDHAKHLPAKIFRKERGKLRSEKLAQQGLADKSNRLFGRIDTGFSILCQYALAFFNQKTL